MLSVFSVSKAVSIKWKSAIERLEPLFGEPIGARLAQVFVAVIFVCVYFAVCAAICVFFGDKLLAAGEKRLAVKGEQ